MIYTDKTFLLSLLRDFREEWMLDITDEDERSLTESRDYEFYAAVLPELDDILLLGLETGAVDYRDLPLRNSYPQLLPGLWSRVFDADRKTLPHVCTESIFALRQISRTFKKVHEVCSDERVEKAISAFRETDENLFTGSVPSSVCAVSSVLHGPELRRIGRRESFPFAHGPGATAEKLDSVARWDFPTISPRLSNRFDIADFFPFYAEEWPCDIAEPTSRLVAVPKTHLTPRLISIEPSSQMYVQQGVLQALGNWMNSNRQLSMRDQVPNQEMARQGSIDGSLATIDLSEASDRVSKDLVYSLFRYVPAFRDLVFDLRTQSVDINGSVMELNKFAPMGSALTFPLEMLVFHTLVIHAICEDENDLSPANIRKWGRSEQVIVYGDDIIVPTRFFHTVVNTLQRFGLVVNAKKSYHHGPFRESCGADWVYGVPVKPVYLRRRLPKKRHDVDAIVSVAATSILLRDRGLHYSSIFLSELVESLIGPTDSGLGAISVGYPSPARRRYNAALQRHEVLAPVSVPAKERTKGSDLAVLAKALSSVDSSPVISPDRLTHHGRPTRAFISRRWVQVM